MSPTSTPTSTPTVTPTPHDADRHRRVVVIAASTRTGSINRALAKQIAARLHDDDAAVVDLNDYPMPLYDGDTEERAGVPGAAHDLARRLGHAEVLVIVSPEYNGTFTPLLKNTVDWVSRVDAAALGHLTVLIASASPGRGGGANGVRMVRTWLSNMTVHVADQTLSIGGAALLADGTVRGVDSHALDRFVQQVARRPHAA